MSRAGPFVESPTAPLLRDVQGAARRRSRTVSLQVSDAPSGRQRSPPPRGKSVSAASRLVGSNITKSSGTEWDRAIVAVTSTSKTFRSMGSPLGTHPTPPPSAQPQLQHLYSMTVTIMARSAQRSQFLSVASTRHQPGDSLPDIEWLIADDREAELVLAPGADAIWTSRDNEVSTRTHTHIYQH